VRKVEAALGISYGRANGLVAQLTDIGVLDVVETVDIAAVLGDIPECRRICTTGGKATEILLSLLDAEVKAKDVKTGTTISARCGARDLLVTRLPSTSRAYPMKLEKKAAYYRAFFEEAGLLETP